MKRYRLDEMLRESESGAWVRYDAHMKEVSEREHTLSRIRSAIGCAPYDSTLAVIDRMVRENTGLRKPAQEELDSARREREEIQDAFAPVLSWYQAQGGEQSPRTLGAMIADAVADLIKDRKDALKLKAAESRVAELERLLSNQMRWEKRADELREKRVDELPAGHGFYVRPDGSVPPNSPLGTTAAKATSDVDRLRCARESGNYLAANGTDFRMLADAILELADSLSKGEQK